MNTDALPAVVRTVARITPRMVRVTLRCPGITTSGRPDEYTVLHFPNGAQRHYTIRDHRPGPEIDVDMVVHRGGVGGEWATRVALGDELGVEQPGGGTFRPRPGDNRWLLVGDATALPAIGRIVESAPDSTSVRVRAVVADAGERQHWTSRAALQADWIHEPDPERVGHALLGAVRTAPGPDESSFTWVAGENVGTRLARRHLRHGLGLPGHAYGTMGYWRPRGEEWEARHAILEPELTERLAAADRAHPDDEEAYVDAVEAIYSDAGL